MPLADGDDRFRRWRDEVLWVPVNGALVMAARESEGCKASPTAGVIDSRSIKTTEAGDVSGSGESKRIEGRERHIVVDALGLMVGVVVHGADAGQPVMAGTAAPP